MFYFPNGAFRFIILSSPLCSNNMCFIKGKVKCALHQELATVLLSYHIVRIVLISLCVGDLARLVLGGARVAG